MSSIGFHANGFVIIDLVPDNDLQTGKTIEDTILDFINEEQSELYCERYKCNDESELITVLDKIKKRLIDKGEIPYIILKDTALKRL